MAYKRKTRDEWQMWSNYGYGWEHELSEDSWREMREQLKCYRANCPNASFKTKLVRVKLEEPKGCDLSQEREGIMYSDDKLTVGNLTVRLEQDTDAESPRDWDNLGTMVCWHRNYNLGDEHSYGDPQEFRESDEYKDAAIVLPLYLYDHSGITMSTAPFSCPWDSGQVGYIYISKDKIRHEYSAKRITKKLLARVTEYLVNEVKTYDDYLTGNVWGFVVEDEDGNTIDSCWGFIGDVDYAFGQGKESAEYYLANHAVTLSRFRCQTAIQTTGDGKAFACPRPNPAQVPTRDRSARRGAI